MAEDQATETMNSERMTTAARFYHLHREQVLAQRKAAYDAKPDVIARREQKKERAALLLQKKQEDTVKQEAKHKKLQELALIAEKTKRGKPSQSSSSEESNPRL